MALNCRCAPILLSLCRLVELSLCTDIFVVMSFGLSFCISSSCEARLASGIQKIVQVSLH